MVGRGHGAFRRTLELEDVLGRSPRFESGEDEDDEEAGENESNTGVDEPDEYGLAGANQGYERTWESRTKAPAGNEKRWKRHGAILSLLVDQLLSLACSCEIGMRF